MNCPICGAKIKNNICPYCQITDNQIIYASNLKAKEYRKQNKNLDKIYYSTVMPKEIDKVKLWLLLVIGGWFGADSYYTGKYSRAIFLFATYICLLLSSAFLNLSKVLAWGKNAELVCQTILSFFSIFGVVAFLMTFFNIFFLMTKKYKFPVVLETKKLADQMNIENGILEKKKQMERNEIYKQKEESKYEKIRQKENKRQEKINKKNNKDKDK